MHGRPRLQARLVSLLRGRLRDLAVSRLGGILSAISSMTDPRQAAAYLGEWLRPLTADSIVGVLAGVLEGVEEKRPGSDRAVQAMLSPELRSKWEPGLSVEVQTLARAEGHFDLAAILLEMPPPDARVAPPRKKLPKELEDIPLGRRKSMARKQDIGVLERLLSDPADAVTANLLDNPRLTDQEVVRLAAQTNAGENVLEMLALHPRWITRYRVKLALVNNPSTPLRITLGLLRLLMTQDLREISGNARVSGVVTGWAKKLIEKRRERSRRTVPLPRPGESGPDAGGSGAPRDPFGADGSFRG